MTTGPQMELGWELALLSGVLGGWREARGQPLKTWLDVRGIFFCSPYPLSATETGTEAVLSAASEIGSTAIVFVVTPAALLGLAC